MTPVCSRAGLRAAPKTPKAVQVGPARYLTMPGQGEPGAEAFTAKVATDRAVMEIGPSAGPAARRGGGVWPGGRGHTRSEPRDGCVPGP